MRTRPASFFAILLGGFFSFCGAQAHAADEAQDAISGVVRLAPDIAKRVKPGGTLFVYVRPFAEDRGPPTAVVAIRNPSYPQKFVLRSKDQMLAGSAPQPLSGNYRLYARHSPTGEPMSGDGFVGTTLGSGGNGVRVGSEIAVVIEKSPP